MTPVQTATELDAHYNQPDPWGYHGNPHDERRRIELLGTLPPGEFRRVLDIGCGNGFVTLALPGEEIVGIDMSAEATRYAKEYAAQSRYAGKYHFETMSLFDPALATLGHFDLVVITGVLYPQYIGKAQSVARLQLDRVLKPGGIVASCHIREWGLVRLPYSLLDITLYPYRQYTHQLEVYRK